MTTKQALVHEMCETAERRLQALCEAYDTAAAGEAVLPKTALIQVLKEVRAMKAVLDPKQFSPGYGRFIMDFEDDDKNTIALLSDLEYKYLKLK